MTKSWRQTGDSEEIERVRNRRLCAVRQLEFFRLVAHEPCPQHPDCNGIAFRTAAHGALLERYMRDGCTCDVYGASEIRLQLLLEDGKVSEVR
jgi:hypothetical protein